MSIFHTSLLYAPVDLNKTPVVTAAATELYSSSTPRIFPIAAFVEPYSTAKSKI